MYGLVLLALLSTRALSAYAQAESSTMELLERLAQSQGESRTVLQLSLLSVWTRRWTYEPGLR